MDNLVSILIPVYNVAPYIRKCFDSISNQTLKNYEVIIVDDGSTDGSGAICDEYAAKDCRWTVIHKKNGGLVSARKAALEIATGDYIGFVDSDDWIDLDMFSMLVDNISANCSDIVISGVYKDCDATQLIPVSPVDVVDNPSDNKEIWKAVFSYSNKDIFQFKVYLCCKLFKADIIKEIYKRIPDECSQGEDDIATVGTICCANRISFERKALYHYNNKREGNYVGYKKADILINYGLMFNEIKKILLRYNKLNFVSDYFDRYMTSLSIYAINNAGIYPYRIVRYKFDESDIKLTGNIVIYGAGSVGYDYFCQLMNRRDINIINWVDKNAAFINQSIYTINPIDSMSKQVYDMIVIAVSSPKVAEVIKTELIALGIESAKLVWKAPVEVYISPVK